MPVTIEATFSVQMNNSPVWKVTSDLIRQVDAEHFIRLRPWDLGLVKLVAHEVIDLPKKCRPSLVQCPCFKALIKLRNEAYAKLQRLEDSDDEPSLFERTDITDANNKPTLGLRPARINAAQLNALRQNVEAFDVEVPGAQANPSLLISMVKPAHPCDELCVKLDACSLEHIVHFIREEGVDVESLMARRQYGSASAPGVWRNGSAGLVRRLDGESPEDEGEAEDAGASKKQRFKSCNSDTSVHHPLMNGEVVDSPVRELGAHSDSNR